MRKMRKLLPFGITAALVAVLALGGAQAVNAATFYVTSPLDTSDAKAGDGVCKDALGFCTLRAAVEEANAYAGDDTILLYGGVYGATNPLTVSKEIKITGNTTISGCGFLAYVPVANWILGCDETRLFNIGCGAKVAIKGVTIKGGKSKFGGAIFNSGDLTLENSILCENEATGYLEQLPATTPETYYGGGGAIFNKCKLTVKWCEFNDNTAPVGGAIANFMESGGSISYSAFCNNFATIEGNDIHGPITVDTATTLFIP